MSLRRYNSRNADFQSELQQLLAVEHGNDGDVAQRVSAIISGVQQHGDTALLDYTCQFDFWNPGSSQELALDAAELEAAYRQISEQQRSALEQAAERIQRYHEHQKLVSWSVEEEDGTLLGQRITPLDNVGVYVPGGKASYPSSVLMNVIPARVAGVERVCMVVPTPRGELMPMVLAAAFVAGVDEVWRVGGAQAIAALAYGTQSIAKVDKIVGPGNVYVATAKRQVFGEVGLDMIAGPSEVLIITDGEVNPDWLALDMFAQAEHDEMAQSLLLCPDAAFLDRVAESIERLLPTMKRSEIIAKSLRDRGALIEISDLAEGIQLANQIAPEHLQLAVKHPDQLVDSVRHAGAIFMGVHTPESLGDYCAGPNHVLPTSSTARFASPLGVYDFQKRTSVINCSPEGAARLADIAGELAFSEGLEAHALSALARRPKAD
ncbi:MAG: histidinol dehydrogenase [Pseudomonadales bacterium]